MNTFDLQAFRKEIERRLKRRKEDYASASRRGHVEDECLAESAKEELEGVLALVPEQGGHSLEDDIEAAAKSLSQALDRGLERHLRSQALEEIADAIESAPGLVSIPWRDRAVFLRKLATEEAVGDQVKVHEEEPRYTLEQVRTGLLRGEVIDAGLMALPDLSRRWWNALPAEERQHLRRELRAQVSAALDHFTQQPAGVGAEEECLTCGSEVSDQRCPNSKRPCGHHCNCSWIHDRCHWCGKEFGEETVSADSDGNQQPQGGEQ